MFSQSGGRRAFLLEPPRHRPCVFLYATLPSSLKTKAPLLRVRQEPQGRHPLRPHPALTSSLHPPLPPLQRTDVPNTLFGWRRGEGVGEGEEEGVKTAWRSANGTFNLYNTSWSALTFRCSHVASRPLLRTHVHLRRHTPWRLHHPRLCLHHCPAVRRPMPLLPPSSRP